MLNCVMIMMSNDEIESENFLLYRWVKLFRRKIHVKKEIYLGAKLIAQLPCA